MTQMIELTIYRTYHPFVHRYLRQFDIPYKSEAFGLLMTLDIADVLAKRIAALLPTGAVVDMYELSEEETTTVAEVKSIQFAVWRVRNGEKVKSWMHFPRRAAVKFNGDSFTIMDLYFNRPMITYTLVRDE